MEENEITLYFWNFFETQGKSMSIIKFHQFFNFFLLTTKKEFLNTLYVPLLHGYIAQCITTSTRCWCCWQVWCVRRQREAAGAEDPAVWRPPGRLQAHCAQVQSSLRDTINWFFLSFFSPPRVTFVTYAK